jgi:hypothetical protein
MVDSTTEQALVIVARANRHSTAHHQRRGILLFCHRFIPLRFSRLNTKSRPSHEMASQTPPTVDYDWSNHGLPDIKLNLDVPTEWDIPRIAQEWLSVYKTGHHPAGWAYLRRTQGHSPHIKELAEVVARAPL